VTDIRSKDAADEAWVRRLIVQRWGAANVVVHGTRYYPAELPGFVAVADEERLGLVTYHLAVPAANAAHHPPLANSPRANSQTLKETSMSPTDPPPPLIGVIMGSTSDWETMRHAAEILSQFDVPHETRVVSAHRTPVWMAEYAGQAEGRGLEVIIAGAGGAAHLPGMVAAHTLLPVLGVPVQSQALNGLDSLLSIVQMPGGVPVGTMAIGKAGATNAALLAVAILGNKYPGYRDKLRHFRAEREQKVRQEEIS
jgi:5-(carboxyamino)imidazole ribonucleotide mutase